MFKSSKSTKVVSLVLLFVTSLFIVFSQNVFAHEEVFEENDTEEIATPLFLNPIELTSEDDDLIISNFSTCPNCWNFAWQECSGDIRYYTSGTHNTVFTKGCTVTYYRAGRRLSCYNCGYRVTLSGRHDCVESHSKCSKGYYKVCPVLNV